MGFNLWVSPLHLFIFLKIYLWTNGGHWTGNISAVWILLSMDPILAIRREFQCISINIEFLSDGESHVVTGHLESYHGAPHSPTSCSEKSLGWWTGWAGRSFNENKQTNKITVSYLPSVDRYLILVYSSVKWG